MFNTLRFELFKTFLCQKILRISINKTLNKKVRKWKHKILKEPHVAITKQTQNYRVPILVIIFLKIHKENIK